MAFRCLVHKSELSHTTGANAGSTTTAAFTLPKAPLLPKTFQGTVLLALSPNGQTLTDNTTTMSHTANLTVTGSGGASHVTAAVLDHFTGVVTLTFNSAPNQAVNLQTTYTGQTTYSNVTDKLFMANCPKSNLQCNARSSAYVPAITVCNQFYVH